MHVFLSVLGWVLLALLALLILLLVLPVFVLLEWKDEAFTAKLRVLFFTFTLFPMKETPEAETQAEQQAQEKEAKQAETQKKKPKKKSSITFDTILGLVSTAGAAMRIVLRGLWFSGIRIEWPVHRDTPAETAVAYGQTHAYFGGAVAALRNFLHLKFKTVNIISDFNDEYADRTYFYCKIGATPVIMVAAGIYALVRIKRENIL